MKVWKTSQFRQVHGAMHTQKMITARVAPRSACSLLTCCGRFPFSTHSPQTGMKSNSVEFESAISPQSSPSNAHCRVCFDWRTEESVGLFVKEAAGVCD